MTSHGALSYGALPPETYRVSQLGEELKDFLSEAYASVWVAGEVERARASQRGHLYFELVEKGDGDRIVAKLDAVLWRSTHQRVRRMLQASGPALRDGLSVRCRGRIDFYPPAGRLQFIVDEVDPVFTLGELERRRRETLAALAAAGLLEVNRSLPLPDLPLRIGLITSRESAAYHDFLAGLEESGYGFRVILAHAAMQGREAEAEVERALELLAGAEVDCVVLIRGGGSRTDLAAFDSRRIAAAVARAPWPVLTGLGHQIDRSITDEVSHTAFKTPTKVAEFLVERLRASELALDACEEALVRASRERLRAARDYLERYERVAHVAHLRLAATGRAVDQTARVLERLACRRLGEAKRRLADHVDRLRGVAPRAVERRRGRPEELVEAVARSVGRRLEAASARLDAHARLAAALAPERLLERGYSITRDADGAIVKDPLKLESGDLLVSELANGEVVSRVEKA